MEKKPISTEDHREGGIGRNNFISQTSQNDQQKADATRGRDISSLDQQEGQMNNGTIGGNMDASGKADEKEE